MASWSISCRATASRGATRRPWRATSPLSSRSTALPWPGPPRADAPAAPSMGTFHQNRSALHGITVVVDTTGPEIFVGRCDDEDDRGIVLNDVDVHRDGEGGRSKEQYVERAARLGTWKK